MSISVASAASIAHNEPTRSASLFPGYVRENPDAKIVQMIRHYYEYLNSKDNPSHELENLISNHDIDEMSDKYLTAIELQIAKSVPNSVTLDKRRLFKIIAQYYKTRGSEESIHIFFRIFFNEFVTIFYPSSGLFHTSDNQSESSTNFRLQDGERWQKYSYEIRTLNNPLQWKESFLKFVHPAGLKLLIAVIVFCFAENNWEGSLEDFINNPDALSPDEYWNNIKMEAILGKHSPKWQPNTDAPIDYLFKVIIDSAHSYRTHTYPIYGISEDELYAAVLNVLLDLSLLSYGSTPGFRSEYQIWLKYKDSLKISDGYSNLTIDDASAGYRPMNECRFEVMTPTIEIEDDYVLGYVNATIGASGSSGCIGATGASGATCIWETSSVEAVVPPDISNMYDYTTASGNLTYTSVDNLTNTIAISAENRGPDGNLIVVRLLNPIATVTQNDLVVIDIFGNNIAITPMPGALCSHITAALNLYAGNLITATQTTPNHGEVKPNLSLTDVASVTLSGGSKTINPEIAMQRQHRYGYIPEADEIIF
jgi:hypothetical protein